MNILQKTADGKYADIGAMIQEIMDGAGGMSSNKILKRARIATGTVSRWKKGENLKTIALIRKLADVCEEIRIENEAVRECEAAQAFAGVATPEAETEAPTDETDEWLN